MVEPKDAGPSYVVGVGASAGGLEALEELFAHMPPTTNMAFVVIQHLSPDYESHMDRLLARRTDLQVSDANHNQRLEANHIYLSVARTEMIVSDGRLLLAERESNESFTLPIDHFFRSLAQDFGSRAIGVILSGTGSDGTRGVREINEAGGLVVCQTPAQARFDGMPRSALDSGAVDLVLDAGMIPKALLEFADVSLPAGKAALSQSGQPAPSAMERIISRLHSECGIDFNHYKPTTVMRRVQRRLQMGQMDGMDDYAGRVTEDRAELNELYRDLLIGVTRFFRDEDAFQRLEEEVVRPLVRERAGKDIRVWVAGCATGEEAYSIAIMFQEVATSLGLGCAVKIFATDVHAASLEVASQGRYSAQALDGLSQARLQRFFVKEGADSYRVSKALRTSVVFAKHNVLKDAPFTRLDLVTCRNLLIYLQPAAQKRVLTLFHFSLRTAGALFLGGSETPGPLGSEFEELASGCRIYRKRRDVRLSPDNRQQRSQMPTLRGREPARRSEGNISPRQLTELYSRILDDELAESLLVDEEFRLLHTFGGAERFLRVPPGRVTSSALELVPESIRTPLAGALQQAHKQQQTVKYSGLVVEQSQGQPTYVRLVVRPYVDATRGSAFLVQLLPSGEEDAAQPETASVDDASIDYVRGLEEELRYARENLQATIEELETSNEELQATNEELVASNQELQSTNEELHSVNEELYTVNTEHQAQIKELTELTDDLDNLFRTIDVGVVFLDRQQRIRRFTESAAKVLGLQPRDEGRLLEHFAATIDRDLTATIERVLQTDEQAEQEVSLQNGSICLMRITPYRSHGQTDGVVLSLVDITRLKRSMAANERLSSVVAQAADAIISVDVGGRVVSWNRGAEDMFGISSHEVLGENLSELLPEEGAARFDECLSRALGGDAVDAYETLRTTSNGNQVHLSESLSPLLDERGKLTGVGLIVRDITRLKHAEEQVRRAVQQRDQFIAVLSHELRNPMMGIQAALDLLEVSHGQSAAHGVLVRQVGQMSRILADLLDVTRLRRDKLEMRRAPVDLRELFDEVILTMSPRIEGSGVQFQFEKADDPIIVDADEARIQQVLVNLLDNALKFTSKGERVKLSLSGDGAQGRFVVADDGVGIAADSLESIFAPFSQSSDTRESHGGMGLGLALAQSIIRAHGGELTVSSAGRGSGSSFMVTLPRCHEREESPDGPHPVRQSSGPRRVLLVEDDPDNRELLEMLMIEDGHFVHACGDGERAVQLLCENSYDVAVVDLGIPEKDGLQVARAARKSELAKDTKLVALTGHGTEKDRRDVHAAGFQEHLVKPVSYETLRRVLHEA